MTGAPFAPWALHGEAIVALARWRGRPPVPAPARALPGPCLVAAACFTDSPVGPYLELAVAQPARLGARPGWWVTLSVVDRLDARTGGRLNWGFPTEMGRLTWSADGDERALTWDDRRVAVRGRPVGIGTPFAAPMRAFQPRGDGSVVVPGRARGRVRPARVTVEVEPGDPLVGLTGRHPGGLVSGLALVIREARTPLGFIAPLRAPRPGPEPALLSEVPAPRAYSSAG